MPKRKDIKKILIISSGPIVIGQACEFDYSGTQACKVLKQEGFKVILVNSNPATIMTDPEVADRTYIEPITAEIVEKIIAKERPDALLPTLGGQTALNTAVELAEKGVLKKYKVETIGANIKAIKKGEDRQLFKAAMKKIGLDLPKSGQAYNLEEAISIAGKIGFPLIIRPSFTLAGTGGSITQSGAVPVNPGENKTFTINANPGYDIADVLVDNVSQGAISSYPFNSVSANHSISASIIYCHRRWNCLRCI